MKPMIVLLWLLGLLSLVAGAWAGFFVGNYFMRMAAEPGNEWMAMPAFGTGLAVLVMFIALGVVLFMRAEALGSEERGRR